MSAPIVAACRPSLPAGASSLTRSAAGVPSSTSAGSATSGHTQATSSCFGADPERSTTTTWVTKPATVLSFAFAELHLDRVHAVALTADAETVQLDLHDAHAARVSGILVERASRQCEDLWERRVVPEGRVERAPRQHAIVNRERELQAVGVPTRLQTHCEGAAVRSPGVLRGQRERRCRGVRLRVRRGHRPHDAREYERAGEHSEREPCSHSERPNTASPVGSTRKPNDS